MQGRDPDQTHLDHLRQWRNRPDRDVSMGFLPKQFRREVERPYKQLQSILTVWTDHVPEPLLGQTRLDSLTRGVLNVSVKTSAVLYEVDRLLREGLQRELIKAHRGPAFRRVKLRVDPAVGEPEPVREPRK